MRYETIEALIDAMRIGNKRESGLWVTVFCDTVEQRNRVTQILHDDFGMDFGDSGYAERYYNGEETDEWMHPFFADGIEYTWGRFKSDSQSYEFVPYDEFMVLYCGNPVDVQAVASDDEIAALLSV